MAAADTSLAAALAQSIEQGILDDRLGPGRLGTKEELQKLYNVAPATLNETIRILQAGGLIEVRRGPHGGVFARTPSPFTRLRRHLHARHDEPALAADCLRVRDALEPMIVEDALHRCTATDAANLKVLYAEMVAAGADANAFLHANWALHRRMADMSANPILRGYYTSLLEFAERELHLAVSATIHDEALAPLQRVHREIVEAIVRGDAALAHRAVAEHAVVTARLATHEVGRFAAGDTAE